MNREAGPPCNSVGARGRMPDYKFYPLDGEGKFAAGEWILGANSDDEAIALVRARKLDHQCEIWFGNRLVAKLPPYGRR